MLVKQFHINESQSVGVGFYKGRAFVIRDEEGFFDAEDIQEGVFDAGLMKEWEENGLEVEGLAIISEVFTELPDPDDTPKLDLYSLDTIHEIFGSETRPWDSVEVVNADTIDEHIIVKDDFLAEMETRSIPKAVEPIFRQIYTTLLQTVES